MTNPESVLYAVPFGEPGVGLSQDRALQNLISAAGESFGISSTVSRGLDVPEDCFDIRRNQYDAQGFLEALKRERRLIPQAGAGQPVLLGITKLDLFIPKLNFVFGAASRQDEVAVISLKRLDPVFYREEPDQETLKARALKEAIHEIGHIFGLAHCADPLCIMHFSHAIGDTDAKGPGFCPRCQALRRS